MRAREFLNEEAKLPPEQAKPLRYTYTLPGVSAADPYQTYRMGVAVARARSDAKPNDVNPFMPEWQAETVFGDYAVIAGFNNTVDPIIDKALAMTHTPGGKRLISTPLSDEPNFVDKQSPIKPFKGYGK